MPNGNEVKLRVAEAKQSDVGKRRARINQKTMDTLGVMTGDVLEIRGRKTTSAIVWPAYPEDQGMDIIRIDGSIRKNADVSLDDYVIVRKANVQNAQYVTLAPDVRIEFDPDFANFAKCRLLEMSLVQGDIVLLKVFGNSMSFTVVRTRPCGIVKVVPTTEFEVLSEPIHVESEKKEKIRRQKKRRRFVWLQQVEKAFGANYVKFRIPNDIEDEFETKVINKAKNLAKEKGETVSILVDLWERRGLIDSLPWAEVKPDGVVEYVYEEKL